MEKNGMRLIKSIPIPRHYRKGLCPFLSFQSKPSPLAGAAIDGKERKA